MPLDAWRRLAAGFAHGAVSDDVIVARYRQGRGIPGGRGYDTRNGEDTSRVTLVMARDEHDLTDVGEFSDWPHARGVLQLNPLYENVGATPSGRAYHRCFPSDVFRIDNAPLAEYLPEQAVVSDAALRAIAQNRQTDEVRRLLESFVVLGAPTEPWPRP